MTEADDNEIWKDIPVEGFEDLYEVSNLGKIRKKRTNKYGPFKAGYILVGKLNKAGRPVVGLSNGTGTNKTVYVSRMVLIAFSGKNPSGMLCCHNDGNPSNNRLTNLRWDTPKGNSADTIKHGTRRTGDTHWTRNKPDAILRGSRHGRAKLTENDVIAMRAEYAAGATQVALARKYKIHRTIVSDIVRRVYWKHVP